MPRLQHVVNDERAICVLHSDHSKDEVYETDAGTFRVTRHAKKIFATRDEAEIYLTAMKEWDF